MKRKKGYFSISAVAKMFSVHQQTIRLYEKEGLISPKRSVGNTRLFEEEDVEHPYSAVAIYENPVLLDSDAVVWIELLSPSNKGTSEDAKTYLSKRRILLDSELVFVELDYLHETPSTFLPLLDYTDPEHRVMGAHAYRIAVLDARPNVRRGPGVVQEFDVDNPIPTMKIPLNGDDKIQFSFDQPYQSLFESALSFAHCPLHIATTKEGAA